jgi:cytochrome c oxidase cbb3-type subunit III
MMRAASMAAMGFALLCSVGCEPWGMPHEEADPSKTTDFAPLYANNCAGCHGENGKHGPGRILNDAIYQAWVSKDALRHVIEYGRPGTAMPPWAMANGGPLAPAQVTALVEGMQKNWSNAGAVQSATLPPYRTDKTGDVDDGKKLFLRNCFACHGPGARIGLVTDPSYLSLTTNQNLRTSIVVGRPDLGMPDFHALSDQNLTDLVAYLASKRPVDSAMAKQEAAGGGK